MAFFPPIETTFHGHIEVAEHDGKLCRVYRPFRQHEYFLMPIISVENEKLLDRERMEYILQNGQPKIPTPNSYMDADDLLDYHNDTSFSGMARYSDQETNS